MARRGMRRDSGRGPLLAAVAVTALVAGALGMAISGGRGGAGGFSGVVTDAGALAGAVVSAPVRWAEGAGSWISSYFGGADEIRALRAANADLIQWRDQARAMAERLDAYEKLHAVQGERIGSGVTARLVSESNGPFSRAGIVNAGTAQGVAVNWVVINANGLVGRVISVGANSSRVILLTDGDSRVPVMGELTRARAIVTGDKTAAPLLAHLNLPPVIRENERLLTSGDDGLFPRGIAVGTAATGPDGRTRVRLATDRAAVDFVRLVAPSNFPPPLEPVTLPDLAPPPTGTGVDPAAVVGGVLPLAPGAAAVPTAATPEAIRAAQAAAAARIEAETRATREALRKAEAERDALRRAQEPGTSPVNGQASPPPSAPQPEPTKVDLSPPPPPPPAPPPPPPPPPPAGEGAPPPAR